MSDAARTWPRGLLGGLLFLVGVGAFSATRAVSEGERQILATDAAIRRQEWNEASTHARSAASWYVPGVPHVPAAYARLLHIARTTEANNDRESALFAWRAMRAAAEQTAWILQPHTYELALANRAIARLSSDAPRPMLSPDGSDALAEKRMQALLARQEAPRAPAVALVILGLWGAAAGLLGVTIRGVSSEGKWLWDRARLPAALGLSGLLLYAIALWLA